MLRNSNKRISSCFKSGLWLRQIRLSKSENNKAVIAAILGGFAVLVAALVTVAGTIWIASNQMKIQLEQNRRIENNKFKLEKTRQNQELFMRIISSADSPNEREKIAIQAKIEALGAGGEDALDYLIMLRGYYKDKNRTIFHRHIDKTIKKIILPRKKDLSYMKFRVENESDFSLKGRGDCREADFKNCDLTGADFEGCLLVKADFGNSILVDAHFGEANLTEANFQEADLSRARFSNRRTQKWKTDVKKANFSNAIMEGVNLKGVVNLEYAKFTADMILNFSIQSQVNKGPFAGIDSLILSALYQNHRKDIIAMAKKNSQFYKQLKVSPLWDALKLSDDLN